MSHTFNQFKQKIQNLDKDEREKMLKELNMELMHLRTLADKAPLREKGVGNIRRTRKMIAMIKTIKG